MIPNRETLKSWIATRETPVLVQFIKYGICGGLAVIVYMVVTLLLVLSYPERVAETLPDATRALNLNIFQAIAFCSGQCVWLPGESPRCLHSGEAQGGA